MTRLEMKWNDAKKPPEETGTYLIRLKGDHLMVCAYGFFDKKFDGLLCWDIPDYYQEPTHWLEIPKIQFDKN